ncbi:MAG: GNAT family N-acetyltransferase [Paracoccus sp. (in: a-proteobacteria)]
MSEDPVETAFEASWPAAEYAMAGPLRIGRGLGGGMRVSSARATRPGWDSTDIDHAIRIMEDWGQPSSFRALEGDGLGEALAARGWQGRMTTLMMQAPVIALTDLPVPEVTAFALWPPLAIQREIWTAAGIGPARLAVMERASAPKTALLGRTKDRAAGTAFLAGAGDYAVLHALEVIPAARRQGLAGWMIREAAFWAGAQGHRMLLLAVTAENAPAIALYRGLGFSTVAAYRYWQP